MRTTVDLDADASAAVERLRRDQGLGLSQAVNELIRRGLVSRPPRTDFRQHTEPLGIRIDVSDIAAAIETIEGPDAR
ncbi:MAG TPA: hypothetical protein PKE05_18050 [Microthrixaceae bacterium]|nr:hypothetical protein [Microthrixaceae bacterium]